MKTTEFYPQSLSERAFLLFTPGVGHWAELAQIGLGGSEVHPVPGQESEGLLAVVILLSAQGQVGLQLSWEGKLQQISHF